MNSLLLSQGTKSARPRRHALTPRSALSGSCFSLPHSAPALPSGPPDTREKIYSYFHLKNKSKGKIFYVAFIKKENVYITDLFKIECLFLQDLMWLLFVVLGYTLGFLTTSQLDCHRKVMMTTNGKPRI